MGQRKVRRKPFPSNQTSFKPPSSKRPPKRSNIVFKKCGKTSHYANKCWTKRKINEIADEGLRKELLNVLINPSDEEDDEDFNDINNDLEIDKIDSEK